MSLHRAHYTVLDESSLLVGLGRWLFWPTLSFGWTQAPDTVENNTCCWESVQNNKVNAVQKCTFNLNLRKSYK